MERCENVLHSCRTSLVDSPLLLKISQIFRDVSQIIHTCGRCEEEATIYLYYSVAPPTFAHGLWTTKTLHCSVNHPCYLTCSKLLFFFFTKRVFSNLLMFFLHYHWYLPRCRTLNYQQVSAMIWPWARLCWQRWEQVLPDSHLLSQVTLVLLQQL